MTAFHDEGGAQLRRVVALSEEIKCINDVARNVGLEAVNTMLVARRSAASVKGFGVVSTELRLFSGKLSANMGELVEDIALLVRDVAELARKAELQRMLYAAHTACGGCREMEQALRDMEIAMRQTRYESARIWEKVARCLQRSLRLCDMGRALARSARIEAVYGGGSSRELTQSGRNIEETIERIRMRLLSGTTLTQAMS